MVNQILLLLLALLPLTVQTRSQAVVQHRSKAAPILVLSDANSPSISASGRRIAVSPEIGLDEVYDVASGKKLRTFRVPNSFGSQLSADGRRIAIFAPILPKDSYSHACGVWFFDVDSGRQIQRANTCVSDGDEFVGSIITDNANKDRNISADLRFIAGPAPAVSLHRRKFSAGPGVWLWDIAQQRMTRTFGKCFKYDEYHYDLWREVRLTPDARVLVATRFNRLSKNLETVVWDAGSGRLVLRLPFASRYVAVSDDGLSVAATREPPMVDRDDSVALHVGPQGQVRAAASAGPAPDPEPKRPPTEIWDVATGRRIAEVKTHNDLRLPITGLALSPDGKFLATESFNNVLMWDARTGRLIAALLHDADDRDRVRRVVFSSDGNYLVMSSMKEVVKVWRVADVLAEASAR